MKKCLSVVCLAIFVLFSFTFNSFAQENVEKTGLIGKFVLGESNWTAEMESQLLEILGNLPETFSAELIGYTDEIGSERVNIPLAKKRADLVAEKTACIKPRATINTRGVIYKPEDGQNVNYRMVEVLISYENESLSDVNKESFLIINSSLVELQNSQKKIMEKIEKFNNTQSMKAFELVLLQFGQDLNNQTHSLKNGLSENQGVVEDVMNDYFKTIKEYLLLQSNHFFERLQEESKISIEESKRINDSMQEMIDSIGKVKNIQITDNNLSQKDRNILRERFEKSDKVILALQKEVGEWKKNSNSMLQYVIYTLIFIGIILIIQIFLLFYRKNKI